MKFCAIMGSRAAVGGSHKYGLGFKGGWQVNRNEHTSSVVKMAFDLRCGFLAPPSLIAASKKKKNILEPE